MRLVLSQASRVRLHAVWRQLAPPPLCPGMDDSPSSVGMSLGALSKVLDKSSAQLISVWANNEDFLLEDVTQEPIVAASPESARSLQLPPGTRLERKP